MENEKDAPCSSTEKKQRDVVCAMERGEPLNEILEAQQVTGEEFIGWVCGGKFPVFAASLARGFAEAKAAYVWGKLVELAKNGNLQAMRLFLDVLYRKPGSRSDNPAAGTSEAELAELRESIFGSEKGGE